MDKKPNKDKKNKDEQLQEAINNIIKEINEELGEDSDIKINEVKPIIVNGKYLKRKNLIAVFKYVLSFLAVIALIGVFKFLYCDKIYEYFIIDGVIILMENLFNLIFNKFFFKLVIKSLGTIKLLVIIISYFIPIIFLPFSHILSIPMFIFSFIIYALIRFVYFKALSNGEFSIKLR